ncbi:MAG TPA: helix-turn-helix transcriptional regulator [Thermoanaerobaculia bacterium]|nr:helix-turn-helix transcriptional regulator [Thermoanaerobaculia bacterium]
MEIFEHLGETIRRLRKDKKKTLSALGVEAKVGKGQLSRIENGKQEATFNTLAKILAALSVGRKEFFRRYDLVEAEQAAILGGERPGGGKPDPGLGSSEPLAGPLRQALDRFDAFVRAVLERPQPLAQGTVEMGDYVVFFRVVARNEAMPPPSPETPGGS